jgi:YHS domain-containing protein
MFLSAGTALLLGLGAPALAGTHGKMGSETMGGMMSGEKKAASKVTDPVCGMEVDPKTAPSATYKGKTYYFCGPEDKAKFVKDPGNYVKKKPA